MSTVDGLLAKDGAEAVLTLALPDGRAAAVKVHDGADRALAPALAAVLHHWSLTADLPDNPRPVPLSPASP
jgi:L-asparaginase II